MVLLSLFRRCTLSPPGGRSALHPSIKTNSTLASEVHMFFRSVLLIVFFAALVLVPGAAAVSQVPTPQHLTASVTDGPAVKLSWDPSAGLWLYKVYRAAADSPTYQNIGIVATASYTDVSVVPGGRYSYAVSAAGFVGGLVTEGAKSTPVVVTIPASTTKGVIAGKVTDGADGTGISYAQVLVSSTTDTTQWVQVVTDIHGSYSVVIDPGTYNIFVQPPYSSLKSWQAEWYDNAADRAHATPVAVAGGQSLTINIALESGTASTALLQVIHNSPEPSVATVDVYLDSTRVLQDLAFRHATPFLIVPAGIPLSIAIAPGGSASVADSVKRFTLTLNANTSTIAVVGGVVKTTGFAPNPDGRSISIALFTLSPALTVGGGGKVQLSVFHGVTDAPAVDVAVRGVGTIANNAAYGDFTAYTPITPDKYMVDVKDSAGVATLKSFEADLRSLGNQAALVFASGFVNPAVNKNGPGFGLFVALPSGVVVALPPEGTTQGDGLIAGAVVSEGSGVPISGVKVIASRTHNTTPMAAWAKTGVDGKYEIKVPAGAYYLRVEPPIVSDTGTSYLAEWYDNAHSVLDATAVTVASDDTTMADFALTPVTPVVMVALSGKIADTSGTPLADASVVVMKTMQETAEIACMPGTVPADLGSSVSVASVGECHGVVWISKTDALGEYTANIRSGHSYIVMAAKAGFIPEYFNDKQSPLTADVVVVGTKDTAGIDFVLARRPDNTFSIAGTVKNSEGKGIPARVLALPLGGIVQAKNVRFCNTDSAGAFLLPNVSKGQYKLMAIPHCGYAPALYKSGAYGILYWKDADIVDVGGDISDITIGVVPVKGFGVAWLRGHVRSGTNAPLTGVNVVALSAVGDVLGYAVTDGDGIYTIPGVASGPVNVSADEGGYNAATVQVSIPDGSSMITGIDLTLNSVTVSSGDPVDLPVTFGLSQNYPNPFNPSTVVGIEIPAESQVKIAVYNVLGQEVSTLFDGVMTAGRYSVTWNARNANGSMQASGMYVCRMVARALNGAGEVSRTLKMMLVR
jgi:hypothetical protein